MTDLTKEEWIERQIEKAEAHPEMARLLGKIIALPDDQIEDISSKSEEYVERLRVTQSLPGAEIVNYLADLLEVSGAAAAAFIYLYWRLKNRKDKGS